MNIWVSSKVVYIFLATYTASDNMCCDWRGRILSSLNKSRHEVLLWESRIIAGGAKKLDGNVHLYPCNSSYWCFPITVCASELQSW
jgi:hypothetical protein